MSVMVIMFFALALSSLLVMRAFPASAAQFKNVAGNIFDVCHSGSVQEVRSFIESGANVNGKDSDGRTPLVCALMRDKENSEGYNEIIKLLLETGADIKTEQENGSNLLYFALAKVGEEDRGNVPDETIRLLLDAGFDISKNNGCLVTALRNSEVSNNGIRTLLNAGVDVNEKENDGTTALMWACRSHRARNQDVIKELLDAGADVNAQNDEGKTALLYAAESQQSSDVLKALLNAGADVNARDHKGNTALLYTLYGGEKSPLTISERSPWGVKMLLDAGADPNVQDKNGIPALVHAVRGNQPKQFVQMLLKANADVNARGLDDRTVLMLIAGETGYDVTGEFNTTIIPEIINILIDAGAGDATDNAGRTALMWAVKSRNPAAIKALLNAKANAYVRDQKGKTALDYIREEGMEDCLDIDMLNRLEASI